MDTVHKGHYLCLFCPLSTLPTDLSTVMHRMPEISGGQLKNCIISQRPWAIKRPQMVWIAKLHHKNKGIFTIHPQMIDNFQQII